METVNQPGSKQAVSSNVQLFTVPKTDTSMKGYRILDFMPVSDNLTPAEFLITSTDSFVDLSRSYFAADVQLVKNDGNAIADADTLFPTPGLIHTMIKQFTVHWNGTLINPQSDTYPFKWYINTVLNYTPQEGNTILQPEGWFPQTASTGLVPLDFPVPLTANNINTTANGGDGHADYAGLSDEQKSAVLASHKEKAKYTNKKWNTFYFKPMHEVFYMGEVVPPGIEMRFTFKFHEPNFYLNGVGAEGKLGKDHLKLRFYLCQLTLSPTLYKQIESARHSGRQDVKYAAVRSDVRVFTLGTGETRFNESNLFQSRIPDRMVVGLLHPNSYNGDYTYHPYAFQKFGVQEMKQLIHGEEYPYRTLELTHNSNQKDMNGYWRFLQAAGFVAKGKACMITPEMWGHGHSCTLFMFDNTANGDADGPMLNPRQKGDVRLEFTLGAAQNHAINVLIWGEFENILTVDPNGAVLYDIYS